jgi:uncharacterized protein YjaG (DUF416 family)
MLKFDEPRLIQQADQLAYPLRVTFAAACAERLFSSYVAYCGQHGVGDPSILRVVLDDVWRVALTGSVTFDADEELARCNALVPEDDDGRAGGESANDAVAAVIYAVHTVKFGDSREAALPARRCYAALDTYISNELNVDFNQPGAEDAVLGHPVMQAELERQARDLRELRAAGPQASVVTAQIRLRALAAAREFFGPGN